MTIAALAVACLGLLGPQDPVPAQEPVTVHEDVQYGDAARQPRRNRLDLYVPAAKAGSDEAKPPIVMFVHGGSWTGGSKDRYDWLGRAFVEHGFACATINTQLFPFAKPDAMVGDCGQALGFLHGHGDEYGFDGDRLFVMGHSSGAHLLSWLSLDDRQLQAAGVPKKALRGAVLLSGPYDVRARHFALDAVFGEDFALRDRATTLQYVDKTDVPMFLAWTQRDLPGLSLCARMLRDRLQSAGVPVRAHQYADGNHASYIFQLPHRGDPVMKDVVQFLRAPRKAATARAPNAAKAMLWVATDERERAVGLALAKALAEHRVDVVVETLVDPTCKRCADLFRKVRNSRTAAGRPAPVYLGGIGAGGLAVATASLTEKRDGLQGRIVAKTTLDARALATFGQRTQRDAERVLREARLLSVLGDQDPKALRLQSMHRTAALTRAGYEANPVELCNTTAEAALLAVQADDDLVMPMLLAFLFP